ncbi:MAG: pseudouridine synthase [Alphaproteobacteria bacterium]|nr:pseudouridine synthase [Alphaproteobacteria bacterium]MBU1512534.1 pseudouridine synthase [Alphaproteobacteria bacterium]MBU2092873.1 pseudouridine synthase [Alphaproteobacteria bacterium]MBU2150888.1 pseudouridine synthase [Alphaproteobacteria bacterium]MBU2307901.1 pseudouridine synthase [Alphaproteobacteria bacterium]
MVHDPLRPQPDDPGQAHDSDGGPDDGPETGERVAKLLARAGVGSRRDVERLIAEGRVGINGRTLETPGVKVDSGDILTVDGEVIGEPEPARLFRYHKPVGLVTTHKDPNSRPTVFKALPKGLPRLISVGRLDINSEGLLLLTNDGELARALEMPSTAIVRRYRARAHGRTTQEKLDTLKKGITVEGTRYGPVDATLDKMKDGPQGANVWITVSLHEGKNREVRRVLEAIGLKVNRLIRLAYGPLALGTLGVGELEEVGPRVVREQFAQHIDPANMPTGERPQYRSPNKSASRRAQEEAKVQADLAPARTGPKEKPVYKAGWAKPKPKVRQPLKDAALAKSKTPGKPKPAVKAKRTGKVAIPTRPGIVDRPGPALAAPRPRPAERKAAAARASAPKSSGPRPAGPRPSRPPESKTAAIAPSGPKAEGYKSGGYRASGDKTAGPRPAAADASAPTSRAPRPTGPRSDGHKSPGHKPSGYKASGPKPAGPAPSDPSSPGARPTGPRPARLKPSGSPRAGGPGAGPRGPKGSASPPRSSGAHRTGPPKPGGRGPRG